MTLINNDNYILDIYGPDEAEAKSGMLAVFEKHQLLVELA
jgi:hypothetical protein